MVSNGKTLKDIVDEVFSIKEEKAEENNAYLEGTVRNYTPRMTTVMFKLIYLLPREPHAEDEKHWKDELEVCFSNLLFNLKAIKSVKLIFDKFNSLITEGYKLTLAEINKKYLLLISLKEFNVEMINKIAKTFYPIIANWVYSNYKEIAKLAKTNNSSAWELAKEKSTSFVEELYEKYFKNFLK